MRRAAAFVAAILGLVVLSSASAQTVAPALVPQPKPAVASKSEVQAPLTQGAAQLTADNVNAWLDGYVPIAIGRATSRGQSWSS